MVIKMKYMTPEERKKQEIIRAQNLAYAEEQKKKRELMESYKKQQENDRKEKKQEEVKASKANELKYGANVVRFQPPAPAKRG